MTKSFFFYGIYEGNDMDETWRVLHEHFEKLAKENNPAGTCKEAVFTEKKAVKQEGVRD
jgi:hypothetical protein